MFLFIQWGVVALSDPQLTSGSVVKWTLSQCVFCANAVNFKPYIIIHSLWKKKTNMVRHIKNIPGLLSTLKSNLYGQRNRIFFFPLAAWTKPTSAAGCSVWASKSQWKHGWRRLTGKIFCYLWCIWCFCWVFYLMFVSVTFPLSKLMCFFMIRK